MYCLSYLQAESQGDSVNLPTTELRTFARLRVTYIESVASKQVVGER